ncbi:MAG TPA: ABC transporter substrate-binding protein [Micropepsaceae bacterium]|nr:ABC transporter substrate-binding protein [Micropepsaceae bacterium]
MAKRNGLARKLVPFILAGAAALMLRIPLAHADTAPAETWVQQSVNKGFAILKDHSLPQQERQAQFRTWIRSVIDFKRVAVFALGSYAKNASDKQVDEFVNAFSDYLMSMFHLDGDENAGSIPLAVTGSQVRAADDVIVNAKIGGADAAAQGATPMTISFRVRKDAAGKDVIVDILVGGVSVAVTQRDEFATFLQQHDGNVAALSAELQKRVQAG